MPETEIKDPFLEKIGRWKQEAENLRTDYDTRWVKNTKLTKGIFSDNEKKISKTRNRSKIFFRKIWASSWRLLASFYSAFLRDPDTFKVGGRGGEDVHKAKILHKMVEYRRDLMNRKNSLFIKFLWGFQNILNLGWTVGKLYWAYDPATGEDGPKFIIYPNEQVYPDLAAETKEDMRYIIFVNYLTREDMEDMGYDNIDKAEPANIPANALRDIRHMNTKDPLQNPGANEYPRAGTYEENKKNDVGKRYIVWEIFYKKNGVIKFAVTNETNTILQGPQDSPYGDRYPVVMGQCLTEAHKLIGEGFPEPLEGPQESYNANLNMRKDNVALALNKMNVVSRYGGVDLQSLSNSRPSGIVLVDDVNNSIKEIEHRDVTQSSYIEAAADDNMMQEMSGVTDIKQGKGKENKATVAQINYAESNAKIDLYSAIVGETFVRDFYSLLADLIQKFETDEKVFRIANDTFRAEADNPYIDDVYDLDFDADITINVGMGSVGRQLEINQTLMVMDKAAMANQVSIALLNTGAVPPERIRMFDTTKFMEEILPKMGYKNVKDFIIQVQPPQQPMGGGGNPTMAGRAAPQAGMNVPNMANAGGLSGV